MNKNKVSANSTGISLYRVVGVLALAVLFRALVIPHFFYEFHYGSNTSVEGKTVLVTGASLGIGRSLVEEYARDGAREIIMAARSIDKMEATKKRIYAEGITTPERTRIHVLGADLSTKEASEKCISDSIEILSAQGRGLDYLVLNHITNSRFGTWLEDNKALPGGHDFVPGMFATNTFSYMWMATAAIDALRATHGQIIVVSSLAGWIGPPKCAVYSATKHALHGFFDSLRVELQMLGGDRAKIGITIAALGSHDTEGAQEVKHHLNKDMVVWEPAAPAARAMITAGAAKKKEIFHPHLIVYPMVALKPFFPSVVDWAFSIAYKAV
jgi:short-subunit dehydrogenase